MGVLPSVLANAGKITFDIARIEGVSIEWRVEKHDEPISVSDEMLVDTLHRLALAVGITGTGEHSPSLCDRVDLADTILGRAKRRAVVEIGTAIPFTVPGP